MIDHERKLLFVHIARTGGSSIEKALVGEDWWQIEPDTKHLSASQARRLYGEQIWNDYVTFSVVRNPWDRLVSMWVTGWWSEEQPEAEAMTPTALKDFILQLNPHPHERYHSLFYHEILDEALDFVLRFERLQADFSALLRERGRPDLALPHLEQRQREPYRTYYDTETAALVAALFEHDIRHYGYVF